MTLSQTIFSIIPSVRQAPAQEQISMAISILWAMALGAIIGLERKKAAKASGIRTSMLIAGASALVVAVSVSLTAAGTLGDASRGIHGVITGIGFLGAGAIFRPQEGMVSGLTTAASIFYTAAVGCAVAAGFGIVATFSTLFAIFVLRGIGALQHKNPNHSTTDSD